MNIDMSAKIQGALVPYLAIVVGLAVLLLLVVFRSILVPLKAALGFLLSVLAALGAVVAGLPVGLRRGPARACEQTGPIMSVMPIFMMGIVFGLAMDYEVFLVSRMREAYVHGERPRAGDRDRLPAQRPRGGRRRADHDRGLRRVHRRAATPFIKMIGFGLAAAVLFDAFVVRMAIVPAVLALLGDRAWWLPKLAGPDPARASTSRAQA